MQTSEWVVLEKIHPPPPPPTEEINNIPFPSPQVTHHYWQIALHFLRYAMKKQTKT